MIHLTDQGRELYADLTALPWWVWPALVVIVVGGYYMAHWADVYDPYVDRPGYERDPEAPNVCGATDGDLTCTVEPHAGDLHLDETRGSRHHSATFRVRRAA